jgi:5-methylcytosine-specific restriction protein A
MARTANDFRYELDIMLSGSYGYTDVTAGELHRRVGEYPGPNHRMPVCCSVMRQAMTHRDHEVCAPPKGNGASLRIRYYLPRA